MLPLHKRSTLSQAIDYLERGARRAARRARTIQKPLESDELDQLKFHQLGVRLIEHCGAVDVTILSQTVDPDTGAVEWEAEFRCLHCGGRAIDWPVGSDEAAHHGPALFGANWQASDPVLAEAMCRDCLAPVGNAVYLKGLASWLATYQMKTGPLPDSD